MECVLKSKAVRPKPRGSMGARKKPNRDIQGTEKGYGERKQGDAEFDKCSSELAGCL